MKLVMIFPRWYKKSGWIQYYGAWMDNGVTTDLALDLLKTSARGNMSEKELIKMKKIPLIFIPQVFVLLFHKNLHMDKQVKINCTWFQRHCNVLACCLFCKIFLSCLKLPVIFDLYLLMHPIVNPKLYTWIIILSRLRKHFYHFLASILAVTTWLG